MKRFFVNLTVALVAFLLGVTVAHLSRYSQLRESETSVSLLEEPAMPPLEPPHPTGDPRVLSPEEAEVVAEAEYFVCWNGYTHQGCGGVGKIYFEPGESHDSFDQIWARRRDKLEGRAYGLSRAKKGNSTFWTIVFRYTEREGKRREKFGRAYIVEDDHGPFARRYFVSFHHDFPLTKVEKRL